MLLFITAEKWHCADYCTQQYSNNTKGYCIVNVFSKKKDEP
jgi:hypothetical protein